ncbi:MAG: HzsA-related protein [Planctomycetota bacterium]
MALEADWLFQAGGRPSAAAALREIAWARELAQRLARLPGAPDLSDELAALGALEAQLHAGPDPKAADAWATRLYLAVRRVKRRIAFKNPAVDFPGVLLVDNPYPSGREWPHQSRHRNGFMAQGAGRLLVLEGLDPDSAVRSLVPAGKGGFFWRPDLSFDGRKVVFCCKRVTPGDWALQLLASPRGNNVVTQDDAFAANAAGVTYTVSFDIGPTVWAAGSQVTVAGDEIRIELLNASNEVVAAHTAASGPWRGSQTFAAGSFRYRGDGTGKVRFRLSPAGTVREDHFYGAIDNLRVAPEGETAVFAESFSGITGGGGGNQYRTGLGLRHSAALAGWSKSGLNALHAVQRDRETQPDMSFHLYEVNVDGTDWKQLTFGDYDDLDPIYLPDGHIMFSTTRGNTYVRCGPDFPSFILARCDADGRNIYIISHGNEPDYLPSLLNDGRVIYSRWEYTDKEQKRVQSLWTVNPDGTNVTVFWGNQSVWPDHLAEPRAIPASRRVMFTGVGHHRWFDGAIGIVDPAKGLNYPSGLAKVTPDVPWAEVGNGPHDPRETDKYHASGRFTAYKTPYPLSEADFLVSASRGDRFRLYLMDIYGNRELIYEGKDNVWHAMPLKARPRPPLLRDAVAWPGVGKDHKPVKPGVFYTNNVFQGAPELPRDEVKYLRVIQSDAKTYTTWHKSCQNDGPSISMTQADAVKRILGTVPIASDGSVCFEAPPGQALHFQLLDKDYRCIQTMRSFTGVMPGEVRGCLGCHELQNASPNAAPAGGAQAGLALRAGAARLTPPPWGVDESVGYERFVQPVLDRYCAKCHQGDGKARKKLDMTLRHSTVRWGRGRYSEDPSPFKEPYVTLVGGPFGWNGKTRMDSHGLPGSPSGCLVVEGYPERSAKALATLKPMTHLSYVSKLVENASSGRHNKVMVDAVSLRRLIAWVDANGPYLGEEEVRRIPDPTFQTIERTRVRPRLATAPVIDRFDVRQDGDSQAVVRGSARHDQSE